MSIASKYTILFFVLIGLNCKAKPQIHDKGFNFILNGNIENLQDGMVYLIDHSENRVLTYSLSHNGKFILSYHFSDGQEGNKLYLKHINISDSIHPNLNKIKDTATVSSFIFKNKWLDNSGITYTALFIAGDTSIRLYGSLNEVNEWWLKQTNKKKSVTCDILFGRQTEAFYRMKDNLFNHVFKLHDTYYDSLMAYVLKYPYSYALLDKFNEYKENFNNDLGQELLIGFTDILQKGKVGLIIKDYFTNRVKPKSQIVEQLFDSTKQLRKVIDPSKKYNLIILWASWCIPCRNEIPEVKKLYELTKNKSINIIYISLDQHYNNWMSAIRKEEMPWGQLWATEEKMIFLKLVLGYDNAIPYGVLVDNDYRILYRFEGYSPDINNEIIHFLNKN